MKVVHILGPSYSGTTALGFVLNTSEKIFFGSEVVRATPDYRSTKENGWLPHCDLCGVDCSYWSKDFFEATKDSDGLAGIYDEFGKRHPEIDFFVDASKSIANFRGVSSHKSIITLKHPMRMVASKFYNDRRKHGILTDSYHDFKVEFLGSKFIGEIRSYLLWLDNKYKNYFSDRPNAFLFFSDKAHYNKFHIFYELEDFLCLDYKSLDPISFSKYPCHSLGGNRAPVWLGKKSRGELLKKNDRLDFYMSAKSLGDWKIDNKWELLISEEFAEEISALDEYVSICKSLGYEKYPES